jgi:hypothetical protein
MCFTFWFTSTICGNKVGWNKVSIQSVSRASNSRLEPSLTIPSSADSKTYNTALEAMAQFLPTRQHKPHLILHLLLLSGASYSPDEHWDGGGNQAHESLLSALEHWELFGKDQGQFLPRFLVARGDRC